MGESKLLKLPVRPDEAILRLKTSVGASKGQVMDSDTAAFMRDLEAALRWLEGLELKEMVQ